MKKCLKILSILLILLVVIIMIAPFSIYLPGVWLGKISFPRHGEPFLEAHDRAINTFVASKGFGFGRIRSAELWNEQSVEFDGGEYDAINIRLIGLTAEDGARYFEASDAPAKVNLEKARWRLLTKWEIGAVKKLKSGAAFVSRSVPDPETDIRVIAPMFARESCLECHDVKAGELIGALDYWLRIWPPRKRETLKNKN